MSGCLVDGAWESWGGEFESHRGWRVYFKKKSISKQNKTFHLLRMCELLQITVKTANEVLFIDVTFSPSNLVCGLRSNTVFLYQFFSTSIRVIRKVSGEANLWLVSVFIWNHDTLFSVPSYSWDGVYCKFLGHGYKMLESQIRAAAVAYCTTKKSSGIYKSRAIYIMLVINLYHITGKFINFLFICF